MPRFIRIDNKKMVWACPVDEEAGRIWCVSSGQSYGWMADKAFQDTHKPVMEDPPLGALVIDPSDGEWMGEVMGVQFNPGKGEMLVKFGP